MIRTERSRSTSKNSFSISNAVSYGWRSAKKHWKFLMVCILILMATSVIPSLLSSFFDSQKVGILSFAAQVVGWVAQTVVSLGLIGVALKIYDKKKVIYKDLFENLSLIIPYFLGSIVYTLIIIVGLILLVIPGIIWGIKYRYFPYFMVDRKMDPFKAFKASAKITKGVKWQLFFFGVVLMLINIAGALILLVGLLFTIPLSMMAEIYVYRKLSEGK